jgi:hypothetical protein
MSEIGQLKERRAELRKDIEVVQKRKRGWSNSPMLLKR